MLAMFDSAAASFSRLQDHLLMAERILSWWACRYSPLAPRSLLLATKPILTRSLWIPLEPGTSL